MGCGPPHGSAIRSEASLPAGRACIAASSCRAVVQCGRSNHVREYQRCRRSNPKRLTGPRRPSHLRVAATYNAGCRAITADFTTKTPLSPDAALDRHRARRTTTSLRTAEATRLIDRQCGSTRATLGEPHLPAAQCAVDWIRTLRGDKRRQPHEAHYAPAQRPRPAAQASGSRISTAQDEPPRHASSRRHPSLRTRLPPTQLSP